jgi:fatty-acyl-CoA synthase
MRVHEHSDRQYDWVGAVSERRAQLSPDRVALIDAETGDEYTYSELEERANRTARLLRKKGIEKGDRIAVVSRNRTELIDLYFATAKLGAILAPLSHRLAPGEIGELLDDVAPSLLVVEQRFQEEVTEALHDSDRKTTRLPIVCLQSSEGTDPSEDERKIESRWKVYEDARPADGSPVEKAETALSDPHLFLHTGGSTGLPKEVVQTHGGIMWNAFNTILSWGLRPDDITPMVFPLFHTGGWNVITIPLFQLGGTIIISREFEAKQVLSRIEEHEASLLVAVPAVLRFMVENEAWSNTDLSSLRLVKSGGGPCRDTIIDAWSDRGINISQGYGLTECGPNNFTMPDTFDQEKTDSIGVPGLYVDARIVDDSGEVPQGEVGELELRSPHAGRKYWQNTAETRETFGGGWVSTGDLARIDDDGYYYIEGRKKNLFVSGGENVYPPEVEAVVTDHPKVEEAIVVPVDDETWGTVGKAVVEGDDSLTLEELRSFMQDRIAGFKIPKHLEAIDSMPISGAGKIQRTDLEERYGDAANPG